MKKAELKLVDMSLGFSLLWMKKMDDEIAATRDACRVTCNLFTKFFKGHIVDNVDADKKPKHNRITNGCKDAINKANVNEGKDPLDFCYEPLIQSGPNMSLKLSIESNSDSLTYGPIIAAFGIRYKNYCSNLIRTMFVDPTPEQTAAYNYLNEIMDYAVSLSKVGAKLNDIYSNIQKKITNEKPNYAEKLTKSFGFITGIEFRDSNLLVSPKSTASLTHNAILNLNIGFQGLSNSSSSKKDEKSFSIWLGDIIHVTNDGPAVLTSAAKRRFESVSLFIKDQSDSEEEEVKDKKSSKSPKKSPEKLLGRGHRKAIVEQKTRNEAVNEDKRAERRRELFHSMMKESEQRLSGVKTGTESTQKVRSKVSYKGFGQIPNETDVKRLYVYVDKKYETVIFPILGQPCPLHVSTIKNVSVSVEGQYTFLRVNLHIPKNIVLSKESNSPTPNSIFIKELTLRALNEKRPGEVSAPASNINNACRIIKEALKKFRSKEAEERERADLIEQDELVVSQPKGSFRLKDLYVRPNIATRRITGCLEAHTNGYRFISTNGDRIDILYNNIKHAFYQPCDGEMIILLHFHLKNAIMFAKKKQSDIQFYSEVGELTTDLGKVHSRMHDRDDLESEQREREMREEIKKAFKTFVDRSENLAKKYRLDFESPFRDLGFHGCPFRSTVFLMPTSSCLISLIEMPFLSITLSEVEFVMFERVSQAVRTFDMVFVFKDYSKKVLQVNSIPTTSYELIKEWLISCDIYYAEGSKSLNWAKIMKTITDNPEEFITEGGWSFICPEEESDEEEGADEEEADENYKPTSDSDAGQDDGDESSFDSDDAGSTDESEDWDAEEDSEEGSLDSDESEGLDWDELEERAINEDKKRDNEALVKGGKRNRSPSPKGKSKKSRR